MVKLELWEQFYIQMILMPVDSSISYSVKAVFQM